MVAEDWVATRAERDYAPERPTLFRHGEVQLVVGRTADGALFAIDNRCPHEGYPLAQGALKGCVLTCAWHNWKFDVRDGSCVLGGEAVRSYPVRVRDGRVEVNVAPPDPAVVVPRWRASFELALFEGDGGRALRDATRLLQSGYAAPHLLLDLARYDAERAEYGTTHVLPLAADCARVLPRFQGNDALRAIAPVIELCIESNRRLAPRPLPSWPAAGEAARAATAPAPTSGLDEEPAREFLQAVEEQNAEHAETLLRAAFAANRPIEHLETWLYAALARHFTDFGHQLIYLVKAQEFMAAGERAPAAEIYPALLYSTVLATREDTLPYMRAYFSRAAAIEPELPLVWTKARPRTPFDPEPLVHAVLEGTAGQAFDAVWRALQAWVPPADVARALVAAAAQRLLRFDAAIDADPGVQEGWLYATHRLTFASAVRHAVQRFQHPEALRFLFQAAAFVHSGQPMDLPAQSRMALEREPGARSELAAGAPSTAVTRAIEAIATAVQKREPESAVLQTADLLRRLEHSRAPRPGHDPRAELLAPLRQAFEDICLHGVFVRPIFDAHAVKTLWVAFDEYDALSAHPFTAYRHEPILAAVRFLASPVAEKNRRAAVDATLHWIVDGKVPKKLTQ